MGTPDVSGGAVVVGARVMLFGQHLATVRYVGPVDGQAGHWIGIEYDDPAAGGKHDGFHAGRRYFACAHPTAGSFVRLPKFLEAASLGRPLAAAAAERYGSQGSPPAQTGSSSSSSEVNEAGTSQERQGQPMFVATAGNRRLAVELVTPQAGSMAAQRVPGSGGGMVAALVSHAVSSLGSAKELRATLPMLGELDLSDNLISCWSFVHELTGALPTLHTLNLSGNRMVLPHLAQSLVSPAASLAGLQTLVLNRCGLNWAQAVAVGQQLPALRELHLCGNRLTNLTVPAAATASALSDPSGVAAADSSSGANSNSAASALLASAFSRLELLDLENNEISSWSELVALGALPLLRSLLLSGNRLPMLQYSGGFTALHSLLLGSNQLDSWAAVDQLDRFPALEEARLSDNPITVATPGLARYQCIARISRLTSLNASVVSTAERWDAEVNYLRLVTDELAAVGTDEAARERVLANNPRFTALTQKYGELSPAVPKASTGTALASSMAELIICRGEKQLQKKLPVTLTVGKLKLMLERLLRVKAAQQALLLVPPPESGLQPDDITDEDFRELRYYDICDGCRLEVSTSDPAARAAALVAAKAATAAAHAQRMERHEQTLQHFRSVEEQLMAR